LAALGAGTFACTTPISQRPSLAHPPKLSDLPEVGTDRNGRLLFNAQYPAGVNSYRAYLLPWH